MGSAEEHFQICADQSSVPTVYGVACAGGERAERLSTDYEEVKRLVDAWNRCELSMVHFWEAVEDFRHTYG